MQTEILSTPAGLAPQHSSIDSSATAHGQTLGQFEIRMLDPVSRLMLTSDGSLTDLLEAAFLERISAHKLVQNTFAATDRIEPLDIGV
jgi:hypothetical protein